MRRRGFLKALAAGLIGTAAGAVDLERLTWEPGKKAIFDLGALPGPADYWIPGSENTFIPHDWVIRATLDLMVNNLNMGAAFDRAYGRAPIGDTVRIRFPQRFAPPPNRMDVLFGMATLLPDAGVRFKA